MILSIGHPPVILFKPLIQLFDYGCSFDTEMCTNDVPEGFGWVFEVPEHLSEMFVSGFVRVERRMLTAVLTTILRTFAESVPQV